ncbi:MAG: hypothetical protein ABIR30_09720 [Chitinophagaceae bacterium]
MKKILLMILSVYLAFQVSGQGSNGSASSVKQMSVEEANKLNGTVMPTINGKPYSQYKAEQDALKQQTSNNQVAFNSTSNSGLASLPQQSKTVAPPAKQKADIQETKPVAVEASSSIVKKEEEKAAPSKEAIALREMLTGQTSVPEDKTVRPAAPLQSVQGTTVAPTTVPQESKTVTATSSVPAPPAIPMDNGVKVASSNPEKAAKKD